MLQETLRRELYELIAGNVTFLPDLPEENAESTLRALWMLAKGQRLSPAAAMRVELGALNIDESLHLRSLVDRRIGGVPLSHLTERQSFMDIEMLAGPEALVPRPETELLARVAISLGRKELQQQGTLSVVDTCTGSGNVALAIAYALPNASILGCDLSEDAIDFARRNAAHTALEDRVKFLAGDLLDPVAEAGLSGTVDLLTCNPPYISSGKLPAMPKDTASHEPKLAFDGGPFGVSILMRLIEGAPRCLRNGGWLAFEVGLGQGPALVKRLEKSGHFGQISPHMDAEGHIRAVSARKFS